MPPPRLDFDNVCRLCMKLVDGARNRKLVPLFRENEPLELAKKIEDIADVKVISGDGLPGQVCRACMKQIDALYAFRQKCRTSDHHFRQYISCDYCDTNSAVLLPSASGDENTLVASDCATDNAEAEMSNEARTIDLSIVKEEIADVVEHYVQGWEEKLSTEVFKLRNVVRRDVTLEEIELLHNAPRNKVNVIEDELVHEPRFPEGPSSRRRRVDGGWAGDRSRPREHDDASSRVVDSFDHPGPHREAKRPRKSFLCDICFKPLGSKSALKIHRANHWGARPFRCPLDDCAKLFSRHDTLHSHLRSHLGIRPYSCRTCGASFVQLPNLQTHERNHAETSSVCLRSECRPCDRQFKSESV